MPPKLMIVLASTRPGRVGEPVAEWFLAHAENHDAFEIDFVDLKALDLPFMDEPKHPRFGEYQHDHTKRWSERVAAADAFAFVHPEYNHAINAPLKNALDFLNAEWSHKPAGIVSYGGISAGTRAAQMLEQVLVVLGMMPLTGFSVHLPFPAQSVQDGVFIPGEVSDQAAERLLGELDRVTATFGALRA